MRNLVPHFILEKYAQGESGGHFETVSLFADISGFSAATHALAQHGSEAAEAMADVMQALFTPLVEHVHAHGGFITIFAGDAFTALFPLEDDPSAYRRALAAAVAIQQHLVDHPVQVTPYGRFPFAIKLGLGDGEVEWGILRPARASAGRAQDAVYFFGGPAIEAAVAAEHLAQPGTLVLSPAVYAAVVATAVQAAVQALPLADGYARCLAVGGELPAPRVGPPVMPRDAASSAALEEAFLPPAVQQHAGGGDFRQVVSVFVQLRGIATRQDLDIFMQAVFDLLPRFGGYLSRVDWGDKGCNLLLFWGMPTSHEHDVTRALGFALELRNHTPGTYRAGLTSALMYAGRAGSAERGEYTCYGDGVNLAARLMQAPPWGSIWLDERLAGRAQARFVTEEVGHLAFKGFPEPQAVYALVERQPVGECFFAGQMVGREAELAELAAFVQPLFAPVGEKRYAGILTVVGEAGVGKSRLVHEFLVNSNFEFRISNFQSFLCQTDPLLRQPLNPFRYWLMGYFDQSPAQSAERNKRAFSRKLDQVIAAMADAALGQELDRTRSCLGALLGLEWESSLYARLDPAGRYENTLQALKALLKAESLRQPVVLLLEDAHWLDEDSQEFIRRLGREIESCPLAVLATARPERTGALFGPGQPYQQLELAGLASQELEQLAADRLGGPAAPELLALLTVRAENNPFFAEQILLYLREQGWLAHQEGAWQLTRSAATAPFPDQIRTIFTARLDRLAEEIRAVVQAAAILGREFEVRVLATMLRIEEEGGEAPAELVELVAAAEREAIWGALAELRYLFKHALLRDAAYEMQLQVHRRGLHRAAAEALEQLYAGDLPPHYGELAYHYEAACRQGLEEARAAACRYLELAARQAAEGYRNAAALDWFGRALALTPEEAGEERVRLLFGREAVYHLLGRREEQGAEQQALEELVQARQRPVERAELALRRARLAFASGALGQAQGQAQAAVAAAQQGGAVRLEAAAQLEWSRALVYQGDFPAACEHNEAARLLAAASGDPQLQGEALQGAGLLNRNLVAKRGCLEQALVLFQQVGNRQGEAAVLSGLGAIDSLQGNYAAEQRCKEQALALYREIGDRDGEGRVLDGLGFSAMVQGNYAASRRHLEQALAINREIGGRRGEAYQICNLGELAMAQGDYETARRYCELALAIAQEVGDRLTESPALSDLAEVAMAQGDYGTARRYGELALAIAQEIGLSWAEALGLNSLAEVAVAQNEVAAARRYWERALSIGRELGRQAPIAESLAGLAQAAVAQGDVDAARKYMDELLPILAANPHLQGVEYPQRALLRCSQALRAQGDPRGVEILAAAHAWLQELAARMEEEERQMFLENVPENRELVAEFARLTAGGAVTAAKSPAQPLAPQEKEAGLPDRGEKKQKEGRKGRKKDHPEEGKKRKKGEKKRGKGK